MENRLKRLETVQSVLLELGQQSSSGGDITEFIGAVHRALGRVMDAANFYVALSERDHDSVRFVYFVDARDATPDPAVTVALASPDQSPTAWVILHRRALVMTAAEHIRRGTAGKGWGQGSTAEHWMGCPLLDQQKKALGAIVVQSYTSGHLYSDEDQALFALIAIQVSHALQGLQSMDRLERAVQERTALLAHEVAERRRAENVQHALFEIASLSASALARDARALAGSLHRIIGDLMVAENFLIALCDPDSGDITIPYVVDQIDAGAPAQRLRHGVEMSAYLLACKQARRHDRASYAQLLADGTISAPLGDADIASWMGAPMLLHGQAYGVLVVHSYDPAILYTEADLELLTFMASHVAVALARIEAGRARRAARERLEQKNAALSAAMAALQHAQSELVRKEKLASLGRLVAGVAHEINTPLGICVTATSHLVEEVRITRAELASGALTQESLRQFFDILDQALRIMTTNTQRAAALVRSFKQVAVDQSANDMRSFNLKSYLGEVLLSLQPKLKGRAVQVTLECGAAIEMDSFPGALSQIVTNMVINSLVHGFAQGQAGAIVLTAALEGETVLLAYRDDGAGMDADTLAKLFDPFFTTRRGSGGSGLGAHIVYNLVTGVLGGTVNADSAPGAGLRYALRFPRSLV